MAALGRWGSVDPLADRYAGQSRYNYVLGNPNSFIDPDGMQVAELSLDSEVDCPEWLVARAVTGALSATAHPTNMEERPQDGYGFGHFGARRSRRDGGSRPHLGQDYVAVPGQEVFAVKSGRVTRFGKPYRWDQGPAIRELDLVEMRAWDGSVVVMMYVDGEAAGVEEGQFVWAGQTIGLQQSLQNAFPNNMTDHTHVMLQVNGIPVDPTTVIPSSGRPPAR
jgi:murein DD-endopeptidase MepM/ murein hydrolase activator NlpD